MQQSDLLLSVIVPVFNERRTVRRVLERVRAVPIRKQIIIVDDGSSDGTTDVIREVVAEPSDDRNRLQAIFQEQNQGKGAAIRAAIPHLEGDITLIQDADLEYDPAEYPNLVAPILAGHADVVYGSRFLGAAHRVLLFRHTMGKRLLTFVSNLCTDLNLTDMETCYKVFRTDLLRRMRLNSNRFGIEPELTAKVARVGDRVLEVGCGVGNFTRFLRDREHVVVTDNNEEYLARLRRVLDRLDNVRVCNVDWADPSLESLHGERFDTILCLNVLEHIENDDAALATFARLLEPGGRLVLQVPAMRALYGEFDRAIHHHRRYERHDLVAQLQGHGFVVEET